MVVVCYARFTLPIRTTRSSQINHIPRPSSTNCLIELFPTATRPCTTRTQLLRDFKQTTTSISKRPSRTLHDLHTIYTHPPRSTRSLYSLSNTRVVYTDNFSINFRIVWWQFQLISEALEDRCQRQHHISVAVVVRAPERHSRLWWSLKRKKRPRSVEDTQERVRQQRRMEIWVRQWLTRRPRPLYRQYEQLPQELNREEPNAWLYRNFFRVDVDMFGEFLDGISTTIEKRGTSFR